MPFVTLANDNRIYYELTGPEDGPIVMQFGGSLFGRHNFGFVNDGFRERLVAFHQDPVRHMAQPLSIVRLR